jgi:hypothetical protein
MKPRIRFVVPYVLSMVIGGALGSVIFLWAYPSEWFSWPGPGDRSSSTIVLGGLLLAINSLLIYMLLTTSFLGRQSRSIAAGVLAFSLVLSLAPTAVSLRNPTPLIFGPLKAQSFFVDAGQGVGPGSIREKVKIYANEPAMSFVVSDVWTGEKIPLNSVSVTEVAERDCSPMTFCEYRFEHLVEIAAAGAYEIYDSSEPRHRDFFVIRDEQLADSCDIGIVYPNYTWLAYNPAAHENLYTVTPGTWIDHRDPIAGNREDFHTHDVTTNIAKVILKEERCLTPLTNSDIDRTTDWQGLDVLVLTGHDEFWTQAMMEHVSSYVSQGGKVAVFAGNVAYKEIQFDDQSMRHASQWGESNTPEELVLGSAFRFAGYDLLDTFTQAEASAQGLDESYYRDSEGMYVENPGHPIFQNTGLAKGQLFGKSSRLHFQEMDGVPLDRDSLKIDTSRYSGPVTDEGILAYGFATYGGGINTQGAIVEFEQGPGRVVNAGSLNWGNAVAKDRVVERITLNVISYLRQSE